MKWGIIGTGNIARQFTNDMKMMGDSKILGVSSYHYQNALKFAAENQIHKAYQNQVDLLKDDRIQNIYIGIPHALHKDMVLECINAHKNVLCEKPLGINQREVQEMIRAAENNGVLLMEGMWTRFFPVMQKLREWVASGYLGAVNLMTLDMCYDSINLGEHLTWRFQNHNGGGALLDLGIYIIFLAMDIFRRPPTGSKGYANISRGIDLYNSFVLNFDGKLVSAMTSVVNESKNPAQLFCEKGIVTIPFPWWCPNSLCFTPTNGEIQRVEYPYEALGMQYEIEAFEQCAENGFLECDLAKHSDSLVVSGLMDDLRKDWDLIYPQDSIL